MGFLSDLIGGKQKVIPTSSSESSAFQRSLSGSLSTGSSESFGTADSSSLARSISSVFEGEAYRSLFGRASTAADKAAALVPELTGTAKSLFSSGGRFLESLEGDLATEDRLNESGFEDDQIALLRSDLEKFYDESVNPRIKSAGVSTGTLGGSRGEVARGIASGELAREFVKGSTAIRLAGQQRKDALAASVDQLRAGRAGQGIAGTSSLYGLAEAGIGAELAPYRDLAAILGDRTVTTSSLSESGSTSRSGSVASQLAQAFSEAFGESSSKSSGSTVTRGPGLLDVLDTLSKFAA